MIEQLVHVVFTSAEIYIIVDKDGDMMSGILELKNSKLSNFRKFSICFAEEISKRINSYEYILFLGNSIPNLTISLIDSFLEKAKKIFLIEPDPSLYKDTKNLLKNKVNFSSIDFRDLMINPKTINKITKHVTIDCYEDYFQLKEKIDSLSKQEPFIKNESIDYCIMNLIVNRFNQNDFKKILSEVFRVLNENGSLILTAILADEPIKICQSFKLANLNMSYFPIENEIYNILETSGYYGISCQLLTESYIFSEGGVEFRCFILEAFKGTPGICLDQGHAVLYKGPWQEVLDDDGHRFARGKRTSVCEKTYRILSQEPYAKDFIGIMPYELISLSEAPIFDCHTPLIRDPAITKGRSKIENKKSVENIPIEPCC